jgi:ferric-dicitrate binding protein FerR (iron transport regulator)
MNDDEAFVRELMQSAGKRPDAPAEPIAEIVDATRAAWQRRLRARRIRRAAAWTLPIAAALIIGLVVLWPQAQPKTEPQLVATVIRANGIPIAVGTRVATGEWIDVPANATETLIVGNGSSLRLDGGTRLQLVSSGMARLEHGAAYLDCPHSATDVTVQTAAGDFTPAGTQFEVRVDRGGETQLRVREGVVTMKRPGAATSARAGEQLIVARDGTLRRGAVLPYDDSWRWVERVAPMLEIEGKSLGTFLDWIAREKGWSLAFSADRTAKIVLHGSIANMTPDEALQTIAAGSGFTYRVKDGVLQIDGL